MTRPLVRTAALFSLFVGWVGALTLGCSTPDTGARVDPKGPDRATFDRVSRVLQKRCGTLDCHGTPYRSLRLYGYPGQRLDAGSLPTTGFTKGVGAPDELVDDPAEIEANYQSVIALEPEKMRIVVDEHGFAPERLTLVRKARGEERHKGEGPIHKGDNADKCLISWLASTTDIAACDAAFAEF